MHAEQQIDGAAKTRNPANRDGNQATRSISRSSSKRTTKVTASAAAVTSRSWNTISHCRNVSRGRRIMVSPELQSWRLP
jgi:hypothetical protein